MSSELTAEQLQKAETMSMDELRLLALADETPAAPVVAETPRAANGQFAKPVQDDAPADAADDAPEVKVYRKEIINDDGRVEIYEADTLEDLVNAISDGKKNANKKISELITERKAQDAKVIQVTEDEEYVTKKNLETKPKETVSRLVREELLAAAAANQRGIDAQSRFVNTHPLYVTDPKTGNGDRMKAEFERLFPAETEFTAEGLEKAYQSLATNGLLVLKTEGADDSTGATATTTQRTVETAAKATQQSSPRSSGISTRNRPAVAANQPPSMDEAYDMPLDKLRELANAQLAKARNE